MKLNKGEIICPICNGTGFHNVHFYDMPITKMCRKCAGGGKIDWLDNLIKKDKDTESDFMHVHIRNMSKKLVSFYSANNAVYVVILPDCIFSYNYTKHGSFYDFTNNKKIRDLIHTNILKLYENYVINYDTGYYNFLLNERVYL